MRQRLLTLPVLHKTLLALGLMAMVATGLSLYTLSRLSHTDDIYSRLLAADTRGALYL